MAPPRYGCCYTITKFSMMVRPAIIVHVVQSVSAMNLFTHTCNTYLLINTIPFKVVSLRIYTASPVILHHSELCIKCTVFNMASSSSNFLYFVDCTFSCIYSFISKNSLYMFRTPSAHHQEIELYYYIIWYD
jgi:hypothetical protein